MSHTSTYAILDVNPDTFADIEARLKAVDSLGDYLQEEDREKLLVLGTVALRVDPLKAVTESLANSSQITSFSMRTVPVANRPKYKEGDRKLIRKRLHVRRQRRADGGYLVRNGRPLMEWVPVDELIPPDGQENDWVRIDAKTFHSVEHSHDCYQEWAVDGYYLIRRGDPEKKRIAAWHVFGRIGYVHKDFTP